MKENATDILFINKNILNSPTKFRGDLGSFIQEATQTIESQISITLQEEEVSSLLLSAARLGEYGCVSNRGRRKILDKEKLKTWIIEKLCPTTIALPLNDPDILRLLVFCIEITEQMFEGGTRATVSSKNFREKQRRYEEIIINQFIGKLGEVLFKRYIETLFPTANIQLDWEISPDRQKYTSDVTNANYPVSIKSSPSLAGIWAEADLNAKYGVMVKCVAPRATLMQFFVETCGFTSLINFASQHIPQSDLTFQQYIRNIRQRVSHYVCGSVHTQLVGIIYGYFKTEQHPPVEEGVQLEYLGKVREKRYLVKLSELLWTKHDWQTFLEENGLLP